MKGRTSIAILLGIAVVLGVACSDGPTSPGKEAPSETPVVAASGLVGYCASGWYSGSQSVLYCDGGAEWCDADLDQYGLCDWGWVLTVDACQTIFGCDGDGGGGQSGPPPPSAVNVVLSPSNAAPGTTVTVTVTVTPAVAGHAVSVSASEVAQSGGHHHNSRPLGQFSGSSGTTNGSGVFSTSYTASAFGGSERVRAYAGTVQDSVELTVAVSSLQQLGSGTGYSLVGDRPTHPSNHYGTASANSALAAIALAYTTMYSGSTLLYNDQSLVRGGLFDISAGWNTPHSEHRLGTNCDVDDNAVPTGRYATLQQMFIDNGSPNYIHESSANHWHLRF